jgi:cytochrome c peroxidase
MKPITKQGLACQIALALASVGCLAGVASANSTSSGLTAADATGEISTFTTSGTIDTSNPFFQSLGTNGRSCSTCHVAKQAWSITPSDLQSRFASTNGNDPVFRTNDGSNSPLADVSTQSARKHAYSMLLNKGVIRIGLAIPATAEFTLAAVDDPYSYASASELSLFRRPLPSTNLRFVTGVMWDGRESHAAFLPPMDAGADMNDLVASLQHQATDATLTHAQGTVAPTAAQLQQIVSFELGLTTAQLFDFNAGYLNGDDAIGGPRVLANLQSYIGINDVLGADPVGAPFNSSAMTMFDAWESASGQDGSARESIARGEKLFNTKPIAITGVGGLNDALDMPVIAGNCTTCHDAPNVGNHSVTLPINIGTADVTQRTPDMPLYTLRNNATGAVVQTTDPGKAMISGKWADIGKFKGPVLRGLAARAPYFHNGMAASLSDAVTFYNTRFNIGFSNQEKRDLIAFLNAL